MARTVTRRGQVTIPKRIRDRLGIKPGSVIEFQLMPSGLGILLKTVEDRPPSVFETLRRRAGRDLSTDEIMALTRGDDRTSC